MIRPGNPRDEQTLVRLRAALWPDEEAEELSAEVQNLLAGQTPGLFPYAVLVAEIDDEVVGFVEVGLRSYVEGCALDRAVGFIEGWFVAEKFRRQGLGRALIRAAEDWCRERGCREIGSDTWVDNEMSQNAHEGVGFEEVERSVTYRKSIETEDEESFYEGGMKFGSILVRLTAAIFVVYGLLFVIAPEQASHWVTGDSPETPSGVIDMRATYGGMSVGLGILLWLVGRQAATLRLALAGVVAVMASMGIARAWGMMIDGSPNQLMWLYLFLEVATMALALWAMRKCPRTTD